MKKYVIGLLFGTLLWSNEARAWTVFWEVTINHGGGAKALVNVWGAPLTVAALRKHRWAR